MGQLTLTVTKTSAAVNLTTVGVLDWSQWGAASSTIRSDFKSGGGALPNPTVIGGAVQFFSGDPRTLNWTNGTTTPTSSSSNGIFNNGSTTGNGWQLVLPADLSLRTVFIYLGGFSLATAATITASLSDGSASTQTDSTTLTGAVSTSIDGVVRLDYQANSAGQTLTLQWFINASTGNVTLQGAALNAIVAPSSVGIQINSWHPGRGPSNARFQRLVLSTTVVASGVLAGGSIGLSPGIGNLTGTVAISGASLGLSPSSGSITGAGALLGASLGLSPAVGNLQAPGSGSTAGIGLGLSPAAGALTGIGALSGSGMALSPSTGALAGTLAITGVSVGLTPGIGSLQAAGTIGTLSGASVGLSPASAALVGSGALTGASLGLSPAAGSVLGTAALSGVSIALTPAVGLLQGAVSLQGISVSLSPAVGDLQPQAPGALFGIGVSLSFSVGQISSSFTPPDITVVGSVPGFVPGGKKKKKLDGPYMREGQEFGEVFPLSPDLGQPPSLKISRVEIAVELPRAPALIAAVPVVQVLPDDEVEKAKAKRARILRIISAMLAAIE